MSLARLAVLVTFVLAALAAAAAAPAQAADYSFTRVADSGADGFSPFGFECSGINNRGDIAFRTSSDPRRGTQQVQGIYRADADRKDKLTTVVELDDGFDFLGQIPSINDHGEVAFAVRDFDPATGTETQSVMRGGEKNKKPVTIADSNEAFNTFGFEPTVSNGGVVAFRAQLDSLDVFNFDQGLFSGQEQGAVTTHYLSSASQFSEFGSLSRPAINNLGHIAFEAPLDGESTSGIFVSEDDSFRTVVAADPNVNVGRPNLNDQGTVVFHRFFNDRAGEELVRVASDGTPTVFADTAGPFASFGFFLGFQAPALNNAGEVAFLADLDAGGSAIFVGADPVADRVIGTGDTLDGSTVTSLRICEEGLNDAGQLAFQATFDAPGDPNGIRVAVYRATPVS
jgi:hypothetical protein